MKKNGGGGAGVVAATRHAAAKAILKPVGEGVNVGAMSQSIMAVIEALTANCEKPRR